MAMCVIFIPPGLDLTFKFSQLSHDLTLSLNDILLFAVVLRCYFIIKLVCIWSPYFGLKARFYL